ncbi:helix-turn-helix domain-containing protein [Granulicella sp. 5B5]|nr:helix-turn-helix domain-containing protein [Granulicella sp. 5B5]
MHSFLEECPYSEGMPKKSKLAPTPAQKETLGLRLAQVRKERGLTQVELAERTGLIQVVVSDYERGRLRLPADMAVRFAEVLGVTVDELLQSRKKSGAAKTTKQPSLKLVRRMEQIESLPIYQQRALLTTIDTFIAAAEAK